MTDGPQILHLAQRNAANLYRNDNCFAIVINHIYSTEVYRWITTQACNRQFSALWVLWQPLCVAPCKNSFSTLSIFTCCEFWTATVSACRYEVLPGHDSLRRDSQPEKILVVYSWFRLQNDTLVVEHFRNDTYWFRFAFGLRMYVACDTCLTTFPHLLHMTLIVFTIRSDFLERNMSKKPVFQHLYLGLWRLSELHFYSFW